MSTPLSSSDAVTAGLLLELLPKKPRTPRGVDALGNPAPPETPRAGPPGRTPRTPAPALGNEPLPSERSAARALRHALTRMFAGRPADDTSLDLEARHAALMEEHKLLDSCLQQLVKQLATRCVD